MNESERVAVLERVLADMCELVDTTLHVGIAYFDLDGSMVGDWQQRLDEARLVLNAHEPLTPYIDTSGNEWRE